MLLEIACFNLESCLIAQSAGAGRVELCEDYAAGGITPAQALVKQAREALNISLFVMIRPRGGNFVYTEAEFGAMQEQVLFCRQQLCDGVVFGILNEQGKIDRERCARLVELAGPMQCTFHRAFDETTDPDEALQTIIDCGFSRILTSGKHKSAVEGIDLINHLISRSNGHIKIMPGGGIRSGNISILVKGTAAEEFHSAALTGHSEIADEKEVIALKNILSGC